MLELVPTGLVAVFIRNVVQKLVKQECPHLLRLEHDARVVTRFGNVHQLVPAAYNFLLLHVGTDPRHAIDTLVHRWARHLHIAVVHFAGRRVALELLVEFRVASIGITGIDVDMLFEEGLPHKVYTLRPQGGFRVT